nr:MAG TPA: hypothetical protein [Caudoviricetes sp.]
MVNMCFSLTHISPHIPRLSIVRLRGALLN